MTYNSSLSGRQISRVDVTGLKTLYEHDLLGRLNSIHQGELRADFSYWPTGWLKTTTCTDLSSQQQLETALDYDDLGRETLRTLSVDGKALRSLEQTYQPDNKLATRRLCEGDTELHAETFTYDVRGRLKVYTRTPPVTGRLPTRLSGRISPSTAWTTSRPCQRPLPMAALKNPPTTSIRQIAPVDGDSLRRSRQVSHQAGIRR